MNVGEILAGFIAILAGAYAIYIATRAERLPNDPLSNLLKIRPLRRRAKFLLGGVFAILLGLFMIIQGFGILA